MTKEKETILPLPKVDKEILPYQLYKLENGVYCMVGEPEYVGKLSEHPFKDQGLRISW
jgi:hypothetical protein